MHTSSYNQMKYFVEKYLKDKEGLVVVDLGSFDINGTYKDLFSEHNYIGVDIRKGKNVDVVLSEPYSWEGCLPVGDIDVVVSGQTLNHVEDCQAIVECIGVGLKDDGLVCIIVPRYLTIKAPRVFSVKELKELFINNNFEILECYEEKVDIVLIARKKEMELERETIEELSF